MEAEEFKSMDNTHMSGNLGCDEVREMLSDLIDVRRGELPHPDGTIFSTPGMRPMVELHLAGCTECREELAVLEDVGSAYRDFSVGEVPPQMFADYGRKVRERVAASGNNIVQPPRGSWLRRARWMLLTTSGVAAASLALMLVLRGADSRRVSHRQKPSPTTEAQKKTIVQPSSGIQYLRPTSSGFETVSLKDASTDLQEVQRDEGRYGSLSFQVPLLGIFLKTTRDADSLYNKDKPKVGLMVARVIPGGPADEMGLQPNDIIVTLNAVDSAGGTHEMMTMSNGGAEEAVSFLQSMNKMGAGTIVNLHVVREVGSQHLYRTPTAVLGEYQVVR
jgi:hypothetical protein